MFCRQCGSTLPEKSQFCNKCGADLQTEPPSASTSTQPSKPSTSETSPVNIFSMFISQAKDWLVSVNNRLEAQFGTKRKNIILIVAGMILLVLIVGIGYGGRNKAIIGKWVQEGNESITYTFHKDGTLLLDDGYDSETGRYRTEGDILILYEGNYYEVSLYKIKGKTLYIADLLDIDFAKAAGFIRVR